MKKLIVLALCSMVALAEEIPDYMRDGVITVTLKSGKVYTYSTNEWKVVRRGTSPKAKPVEEANPSDNVSRAPAVETHKNRIRVMGGYGPTNRLEVSRDASGAVVKTKLGAVGGIGYDRLVTDKIFLGGQALTNETLLLNIGLDY